VSPLGAEEVERPAYPSEWSIAQVLSHLGSGAEIFRLYLASARTGAPAPEFEDFSEIWDVWNSKEPQDQTTEALAADAAFLDQLTAMSAAEQAQFSVDMFNGQTDLPGFLRLRVGELAVHTWDVLVALDPSATLAPDASALILPGLGELVARAGERSDDEVAVRVTTTDPAATFELTIGPDGPRLDEAHTDSATEATLSLPAEALVRLVYGRLGWGVSSGGCLAVPPCRTSEGSAYDAAIYVTILALTGLITFAIDQLIGIESNLGY